MKKVLTFLLILIMTVNICSCAYLTKPQNADRQKENTSKSLTEKPLKVHFIDVGQGDCIFIELPDKKSMLIDCGEFEYANTVTGYIKNLDYSTIDYVVATHPHTDHMGCMATVINSFKVINFYMPEIAHDTVAFDKMMEAVANSGCNAQYAYRGKNIFDFGDAKADFLSPGENVILTDYNNASAVVRLTFKNSSFIFMGDAEFECENKILSSGATITADVLKCGHHGSSSSTSERFLNKVNPKYAVITVGKGNSYGHPHIETLERLKRNGIDCLRTDESGTIVVSTDGENYEIEKIMTEFNSEQELYNNNVTYAGEDKTVYITKSGKRYHKDGCDSLLYTKIPTTVEEALGLGLTPCKACRP